MKKVGIITIYDENNYGNRLQNYAVQEVLKSMNFDVETIRNINLENEKEYQEYLNKMLPERREKFLEFNKENMSNSELIFHNNIDDKFHEEYDYFVVGSDQIWNHNYNDRFSDFVFATFAPIHKRISFSASFGVSNVSKEHHSRYDGLEEMKAISVREDAGKDIVKDITGRDDAVVLIDPTMMLSAEKWSTVMKKPEQLKTDKYILKYFLGKVSDEKEKEIQRFAKENDCTVIDILDKDSFFATGPSEFLYLIKNSFLVLTDSFHSCVFSIIFERPFLIFERDEVNMNNMYSRIETLLNKFELKNKKFNGKITEENMDSNYDFAKELLNNEQEKVRQFLYNALEVEV